MLLKTIELTSFVRYNLTKEVSFLSKHITEEEIKNVFTTKREKTGLMLGAYEDVPLPMYSLRNNNHGGREEYPIWEADNLDETISAKNIIMRKDKTTKDEDFTIGAISSAFLKKYKSVQGKKYTKQHWTLSPMELTFFTSYETTLLECPACHGVNYIDSYINGNPYLEQITRIKEIQEKYPRGWRAFTTKRNILRKTYASYGELKNKNKTFLCPCCGERFNKVWDASKHNPVPLQTMVFEKGNKVVISALFRIYYTAKREKSSRLQHPKFATYNLKITFNKKTGQTFLLPIQNITTKKILKSKNSYKHIINVTYSNSNTLVEWGVTRVVANPMDVILHCNKCLGLDPPPDVNLMYYIPKLSLYNRFPMFSLQEIGSLSPLARTNARLHWMTKIFGKITPQMTYEEAISVLNVKGPREVIDPLIKKDIVNSFKINEFFHIGFSDVSLLPYFCNVVNNSLFIDEFMDRICLFLDFKTFKKNLKYEISLRGEKGTIDLLGQKENNKNIFILASEIWDTQAFSQPDIEIMTKGSIGDMYKIIEKHKK